MSDQAESSPQQNSTGETASHRSSTSSLQKGIRITLFVILALLIIAIIYDRQVARPAVDAAYETIENLNANSGSKVLTDEDVHEALGREPSYTKSDGDYTLEVYAFRAGLPWRTHDYTVAYSGESNRYFMTHFKFEDVSMDALAPPTTYQPGADAVPDASPPPSGAPAPADDSSPEGAGSEGAGSEGAGSEGASSEGSGSEGEGSEGAGSEGRPPLEQEGQSPDADAVPPAGEDETADEKAAEGEPGASPEQASPDAASDDDGEQQPSGGEAG